MERNVMAGMRRKLMREKDGRWCRLEVELKDGRLSICGTEGSIVKRAAARKMARDYWESFLEESPEEMARMCKEFKKHTPKSAAKYITEVDGEFHGLDVEFDDDKHVYIGESCGQIRGSLAEWFPEIEGWFKWHMNDMNPACEHQEAMGWKSCPGYHRDGETCPAPSVPLPLAAIYECQALTMRGDARMHTKKVRLKLPWDDSKLLGPLCPLCETPLTLMHGATPWGRIKDVLTVEEREDHRFCDYDAMKAPCPVCGYKLGTEWKRRELPEQIKAEVERFCETGALPQKEVAA